MVPVYTTVLTSGYEIQALTLARSLLRKASQCEIWLFCLDDECFVNLTEFRTKGLKLVKYESISSPVIDNLKNHRPIASFCWTCKPLVIDYVFKHKRKVDWVTYLDSDMMVFADPNIRLKEAKENSIILTPHSFRYGPFLGTETMIGKFNAGYFAVRNNFIGRRVVKYWLSMCIKDCPVVPNSTAYADQKYLDHIEADFSQHVSIGFPITNMAPWNIGKEKLRQKDGDIYFQTQKILIFHFQGFRVISPIFVNLYAAKLGLSRSVKNLIYRPYKKELKSVSAELATRAGYRKTYQRTFYNSLKCFVATLVNRGHLSTW